MGHVRAAAPQGSWPSRVVRGPTARDLSRKWGTQVTGGRTGLRRGRRVRAAGTAFSSQEGSVHIAGRGGPVGVGLPTDQPLRTNRLSHDPVS